MPRITTRSRGNLIGTNASGAALGNGKAVPQNACSGVLIDGGSTGNVIGGTTLAARNIISGNGFAGVHIVGSNNNVVEGNVIGTLVSGTPGLENVIAGVLIDTGAKGNVIGGTKAGARQHDREQPRRRRRVNSAGTVTRSKTTSSTPTVSVRRPRVLATASH